MTWSDWLVASGRSRWYGYLAPSSESHAERQLFTGLVPLLLAGFGFFLRRRERPDPPALPPLTRRRRILLRCLDALMLFAAALVYFGAVTRSVKWRVGGVQVLSFETAALPAMILVVAAIVRVSIRLPRALSSGEEASVPTVVARSRFTPEDWSAGLWIIIGVLGSFGLKAFFHAFLYRYVEAFQSIRLPARWAIIAYVGVAVWMAIGIDEILCRASPRWRIAAATALIALSMIDVRARIRWEAAQTEQAQVYPWLSAQYERGPVLELPMSGNGVQYLYLLSAARHRIPIMNGISGFEPPLHEQLRLMGENGELDDAYTNLLERNGCRFVIVHADWLRYQYTHVFRWLQREMTAGRLGFVRRFDHGTNGDWLFAVTRNAPGWQLLRAPDIPDPSGHTPRQNLARLLASQHTYNESTFGYVDTPHAWTEVRGSLEISGWAVSPKGIRRVIIHLDNDSYQVDAELVPRPDIARHFGVYPEAAATGFRHAIPKRPRGTDLETNLQIEIIDGTGRSTRLSDQPVWWR